MIKKIFKTQDGSPSFKIDELNETYHSRYGALTEASYIYIEKGLSYWIRKNNKKEVSIFEMGLGTGLNAYLAFCFCKKNNIKLYYYAVRSFHFREMKSNYWGWKNIYHILNFINFLNG